MEDPYPSWPPKLQKVVVRAFAMCATDRDRQFVKATLINLIKDANATGSLWSLNWDVHLPIAQAAQREADPILIWATAAAY